jgi:hypothetical protein
MSSGESIQGVRRFYVHLEAIGAPRTESARQSQVPGTYLLDQRYASTSARNALTAAIY